MYTQIALNPFGSVQIVISDYALKETDLRAFPESRHRSRRIHKKLVRRFGGEFLKAPCMFQTPMGIICHPALYGDLKRRLGEHHAVRSF